MMGFADASQTTVYEHTMEALPAVVSLVWPAAQTAYYRYGADTAKDGMWAAGNLDGNQQYLVFGLLYNDALRGVEVDGQPAVVVDDGMYRCWFYYGEGLMAFNSESVVYR